MWRAISNEAFWRGGRDVQQDEMDRVCAQVGDYVDDFLLGSWWA